MSSEESSPEDTSNATAQVVEDEESELGSEVEMQNGGNFNPEKEDGLLGGLEFDTTEQIKVPDRLIDQVIGQEQARKAVMKAAKQRRHVMMIGSPGTGKSMLAKAMSEMMPKEEMQDVMVKPNPEDENNPDVDVLPAGKGQELVRMSRERAQKQQSMRRGIVLLIILGVFGYALFTGHLLMGLIAAALIFLAYRYGFGDIEADAPNLLIDASEYDAAPFEDATGAHAGALLGDVRHDPFQSGRLAVPAHERVEAGSIHKANKGVLFIDEINTLEVRSQQKLMTAIQDGEFQITGQSERSSGAMVQTDPVPCDFVMVAAGNMDAMENMHPALRDRIKGYGYEVYMDDNIEDTAETRRKYARFVAQEIDKDDNVPHFTDEAVAEIIREARRRGDRKDHLTLRLRNLGGLVRVAGDIATAEGAEFVRKEHVIEAKDRSKGIEEQVADKMIEQKKAYDVSMTEDEVPGRVNGLAVFNESSGLMLPVMGEVAPAHKGDQGRVIATGKLQEIAEEAVQNVSAIIKKLGGEDIHEKDVHIQFVQTHEGVEGDSASVTVATAVLSALEDIPVKQNVAMTGSLSVRGDVLPVGGVTHKIEAAAKSGMDKVIIPAANKQDVTIEDQYKDEIEIIPVSHLSEVLDVALADTEESKNLVERVTDLTGKAAMKSDVSIEEPNTAD